MWISDLHLGSKDCQVDLLKDFLNHVNCDTLYLLGDIIDFWALKKRLWWPPSHYEIIQLIYQKSQSGTRVVYIPGNHDCPMRDYAEDLIGHIEIHEEMVHETADGKRLLLIHGDILDGEIKLAAWKKHVGDAGYKVLMVLNRISMRFRKLFGQSYWSLATHIKSHIKDARAAIDIYAHAAAREAAKRGVDGIVCGHIHQPAIQNIEGITYYNDGDWVEHCTALVENSDGSIELVDWSKQTSDVCTAANDGAYSTKHPAAFAAKGIRARRLLRKLSAKSADLPSTR